MFGLTVVTEPAVEPLALSEVMEQLRYPHVSENLLIESLIKAARKYIETATGRALITQTLRLTRDCFPTWKEGYTFRLPSPPLQTVSSIQYTDTAGATQTVTAAEYVVDATSVPGRVGLAYGYTWPTDVIEQIASVNVNYVAGYGLAAAVPHDIKQAMRLLIGHWFVNREAVLTGTISNDIEFSLAALLGSEFSGSLAGTYG